MLCVVISAQAAVHSRCCNHRTIRAVAHKQNAAYHSQAITNTNQLI